MRGSRRGERWLGLLLAVALLAGATWRMWIRFNHGSRNFASNSDFVNYYIPMTAKAAERLAGGELPLWNPENCSGIPLLATMQTGVFYPGTWLAVLMPAHDALPMLVLAECFLGGLFALALFHAWGCRLAAAAVGGLIFTFACCMGQTMWPPAIATIIWLPWILLCIDKFVRSGSVVWWAALAVGCALQLFAGFPQFVVYSYYLVIPFSVLRLAESFARDEFDRQRILGATAALVSAGILGIGLAGIQLAPTIELTLESARSGVLGEQQVHYLSGVGIQTSAQVLAQAFDPAPKGIALGYPGTGYLGVASLLLIAVSLTARRREPLPWLLFAIAAVALLLSDGFKGPWPALYELYVQLPISGTFRTPERHRLLTFFAAAGLAALGLAVLERGIEDKAERRLLLVSVCFAAGGSALAMVVAGNAGAIWRCVLAVALLLPLVLTTNLRQRQVLASLFALFVAVDLVLATPGQARIRNIPAWTVDTFHEVRRPVNAEKFEQRLEMAGSGRLEWQSLLPHTGSGALAELRRISCYEPLPPSQWRKLHERITGRATVGKTLFGIEPRNFPALFDVTSVHVVVRTALYGWKSSFGPEIWYNEDALPRAYFLGSVRPASSEEALDHIALANHDFHETVLLDSRRPLPATAGGKLAPARIVNETPERVIIAVKAEGAGVLVLTDSHYPGWEARVDGVPTEILLANGVHRAVAVTNGQHEVVFEYRPSSLLVGASVSAGSLLLLLVVLGAGVGHRGRGR
ncbi:MAG: YfhO family protein [Deltaproteobacteria bacterium]|nr:YfhO family protein [Deltaproteobacteria bacterium]MBW2398856.1 YfhO family protein [Deltaproteobacteria bacterium]